MRTQYFFIVGALLLLFSYQNVRATTFTVTLTNGNASWDAPTANNGSFAGAMLAVNAAGAGPHTIAFNIPGAGPFTIDIGGMTTTLAANSNITIDGLTQPGSVCNTNLQIALDANYAAFTFTNQTNLTLRGLRINAGVVISGGSGVLIESCFFNLNSTGTTAAGAVVGNAPLTITSHTNGIVGGTAACEGNVFSCSPAFTNGIILNTCTGTQILSNNIGTTRNGLTRLGILTGQTIAISTSQNIIIDGNVIAGSVGDPGDGIAVTAGNCNGLQITNNYIGVNRSGTGAPYGSAGTFGNGGSGIAILGGTINNALIQNNVISANETFGITIEVANSNVQILNNIVGLPSTGIYSAANDLGNGSTGIRTFGVACTNIQINNNTVCRNGKSITTCSAQATSCGILFNTGTISSATISGNKVGVDVNYSAAGNKFSGIYFYQNGNMGGSNAANVVVSGNVIGDNGSCSEINSNGFSAYQSNYYTLTNNYVGVGPSGQVVGNYANGIEINTSTNFIITNNQIANNKGIRTTAQAEACGGIAMFSSTNGSILGNNIYNHANAGGSVPNNGVFVQKGGSVIIGSMTTGQENTIHDNGSHAIAVFDGADFVQMRWNSIYCNGLKGINIGCTGTVFGKTFGNNQIGCPSKPDPLTITGPVPPLPTSISGNRPSASIVDVFGTASCGSGSVSCVSQGQFRFSTGTYTPATTGVAGTTWSYNNGTAMYNDLSALATGSGADCSGLNCRTSEFSPCVPNPLPVNWLDFNVIPLVAKVTLIWQTAKEENNKLFIIERSGDDGEFVQIGSVDGNMNSTTTLTYTFDDLSPLDGISYYRVRQVDSDGKSSVSPIRSVNRNGDFTISVVPNPNHGVFSIHIANAPGEYIMTVSDVLGREVYSHNGNDTSSALILPVNLSHLSKGVYHANMVSETQTKALRLIIE